MVQGILTADSLVGSGLGYLRNFVFVIHCFMEVTFDTETISSMG